MKQGLRYRYVCKKDLNKGKICETSKPNKVKIQIRISGHMPAYVDRGLRTQAKSHVRKI